ncbi:unnamed protein product [Fusarium venenatum]|uniref:Uncharacterized protein n=1 Tax=Fusarium venenatum TaxID=56646 RepID=A0A2L2TRW1_9HYPO|nr:uncharacterized protein FVRRES_02958 [Fusarium venenatum]CEI66446.1 unnamed protein product [Fusarium venenatum]
MGVLSVAVTTCTSTSEMEAEMSLVVVLLARQWNRKGAAGKGHEARKVGNSDICEHACWSEKDGALLWNNSCIRLDEPGFEWDPDNET